eukprot:gnl/Spiro4/16982_TR9159_c0_g1_i1.p1 gnl/Spiro4/16982_TR9159_c0_g1~~gnl/Spiro4/16982_TR9159_c0_g1_i1.p1  ORF type:complete len:292 (+),score=38.61 gnl/Spiro4/16982_TR9159_c0_g1_i1:64-876(+)
MAYYKQGWILNHYERPQKKHVDVKPTLGLEHNHDSPHDVQHRGNWGKTRDDVAFLVPHRRHYKNQHGDTRVVRPDHNVLLDGYLQDPSYQKVGVRKFGHQHSEGFLQSPLKTDCSSVVESVRRSRAAVPGTRSSNDLILEHIENTSTNRSVEPEKFLFNSKHAVVCPGKKRFSHKVQVESGGAPQNFFNMPAERSPGVAPHSNRWKADPHIIKFVESDIPKNLVGVQRRKKQPYVDDFTKRPHEAEETGRGNSRRFDRLARVTSSQDWWG